MDLINTFPATLIDRSFHNDTCPSFYFQANNQFYIIWLDHTDQSQREDPESKRYTLSIAVNEGDGRHLEIYTDTSKPDLLHTDDIQEVKRFVESELLDSAK
jgi:hypothetical protein